MAFLAVLIKSFTLTGTDVRIVLKDPSGILNFCSFLRYFTSDKTSAKALTPPAKAGQ